jgi:hypothetical protein
MAVGVTAMATTDIAPFRVEVPQADLDDLRERLFRTRWPDELPGAGWDLGVPLDDLTGLTEYWATSYDWRGQEAALNELARFITIIDDQNVPFLHGRSAEPAALPLLITHGWPGSIAEFPDIIGPLIDPAAHGGDPADAFHVIAPPIPGFGFSGPTHETGWDTARVARAWATLMSRLGYERYGAQGGDTGALVSPELGRVDPDHLIGTTKAPEAGARRTSPLPSPPASRSFPWTSPSEASPSASTTSCTGPSSTAAVTSPPWKPPTYWSMTCAPSSTGSDEPGQVPPAPSAVSSTSTRVVRAKMP